MNPSPAKRPRIRGERDDSAAVPNSSGSGRGTGVREAERKEELLYAQLDDEYAQYQHPHHQQQQQQKGISPAQAAIKTREGRVGELARALVRQAHFPEGLLPAELLLQAVTGEEKLDDVAKEWPSIKASLSEAVWLEEADDGKALVRRNQAKLFLQSVAKHSKQRKGVRHQVYMALQREWDDIVLKVVAEAAEESRVVVSSTSSSSSFKRNGRASVQDVIFRNGTQDLLARAGFTTTTTSSTAQPANMVAGAPERDHNKWIVKAEEYVKPILLARNQGASHWEHAQRLLAVSRFILSHATPEAEPRPLQTGVISLACLTLGLFDPEHVGREVPADYEPVTHHVDQLRIALGLRGLDTPLHKLLRILRHITERTTPPPSMELPELAYVSDAQALLHCKTASFIMPLFAGTVMEPLACCRQTAGDPPSPTLHTRAARSALAALAATNLFAGLLRTRTAP